MAKKHIITAIELEDIKATRKNNKDKKIDKRLQVLELYADNLPSQSISELTGYNRTYINAIVNKYIKNGLSALVDNHYSGYCFKVFIFDRNDFCLFKACQL